MVCAYCQVTELTLEEAKSSKKGCMFCSIEASLSMSRLMGQQIPLPKPSDFGRTKKEYDAFMAKRAAAISARQSGPLPGGSAPIPFGLGKQQSTPKTPNTTDFSDDEIGQMLRDYDPNEPPYEFYEAVNDDFFIRMVVPGPLDPKRIAMIDEMVKKLFTDTVYTKIMGSYLERFFRDPNEPAPPQGGGPFQH